MSLNSTSSDGNLQTIQVLAICMTVTYNGGWLLETPSLCSTNELTEARNGFGLHKDQVSADHRITAFKVRERPRSNGVWARC